MSLEQAYDQKCAECASLRDQLAAVEHDRDNLLNQVVMLREALEKLACLGNGGRYGNSDGNVIAQQALAATESELGQYILCEREPVQWTTAGFCDDGEPLYRAARRPE